MAISSKRFGRLRMPIISLYVHTEHSSYKITDDTRAKTDQPTASDKNVLAPSVISFKTTNAMSDDSATFSIVLGPKDGVLWDRVVNVNDLIEIYVDNNEALLAGDKKSTANTAVMVGLVSEVAIIGDHSSNQKMYQITGQSISKVFSQFKIGMVSEVESQLSPLGWLWDSGISEDYYTTGSDSSDSDGDSDSGSDSSSSGGSWTTKGTATYNNAKALWNYWKAKGFSGAAIAGILGCVAAESMFNPKASQNGTNTNNPENISGAVGTNGYGLYQVSPGNKYGKWSGYTSPTVTNESDYMWEAYGGAKINNGVKNYSGLIGMASEKDVGTATKNWYVAVEMGSTTGFTGTSGGSTRSEYANTAYKIFGGKDVKYSGKKLKSSGGGSSSSSSTSGSSDTSDDNSGSGGMSASEIEAEKAASPNGGVEFYDNNVAGVETALLKRFEPYIVLTFDGGMFNIWDFLYTGDFDSWTDYEAMKDSSSFVNFTGSLYELQAATLRKPFNEMFYDFDNTDGNNVVARMIVRRTPFNPEDWYALDMVNIDSTNVLSENISKTDREQYSVFVDNPATGWFTGYQDSFTLGSWPKTNEDLIKTYGYSKYEVSDYYVSGSNDKDWSVNGDSGSDEDLTSTNNAQGTKFTYNDVKVFLGKFAKTTIDQQSSQVAQAMANAANNISAYQAGKLVGTYKANAYMLSQDNYDDILNTAEGGGLANTGDHKLTYKKVKEFIKSTDSQKGFLTKAKAYFKNVSDEKLVAIYSAAEDGSITKSAYDKAVKNYKKNSQGETETVTLQDTDYFQALLYNWYANNMNFWSGTYTVLGNPDIRLGMILNYTDNYLANKFKYPGRRFYIESVSHSFSFTEGFTTDIGVTRGLIAPTDLDGKNDPRFTEKFMWGNYTDYKGGLMGEARIDSLAMSSGDSGDSDSSSSGDYSGEKGPEAAVKAMEYGMKFEKKNYKKRTEIYAYGGHGERGSTSPLEHDVNGNNLVLDCSSFIYWCFKHVGITTGTVTGNIASDKQFKHISIPSSSTEGMKKGDLVMLYNCGHVMFYVGGGKLMGWNGSGSWDPSGGCAIVPLSYMGKHDGYALRLKG